tara:strand:- start:423 stop:602 length:180 start_codon:yes stop_codon:yes gene_type:complete
MKKAFIKDDKGREVEVDLDKFIDHINQYHRTGTSIHDDENGHYFTVDDNFRKKLKEMTK